MLRGEIWLVDLDPAQSGEADKRRPVVVVSNDGANVTATRLGRGVVTRWGSNVERPLPGAFAGSRFRSPAQLKTQAEQGRSVSMKRLKIGSVPPGLMLPVDEALRLHLTL
ncbi:MAG: type II toxin-antitoxin system PemK/MazF family toxin [Acidimicrobiia bacterium]